jgi:tRNA A37 threonylcarbamoyltransferase TsaD
MDNGVMIAHQGLLRIKEGNKTKIGNSKVKPDWRPDKVEAEWIE